MFNIMIGSSVLKYIFHQNVDFVRNLIEGAFSVRLYLNYYSDILSKSHYFLRKKLIPNTTECLIRY